MLEIRNFSKSYEKGKRAVDNLSLTVKDGEIYGFIGHNGAGKSTTLKAVVGVLGFEEGEIEIDGISVRKDPVAAKKITAFIPDNPDIYDYLTGAQYLRFIADLYRVTEAERKERVGRYAAAFEIGDRLEDLISSYSHGMKQKLVLISAFLHAPKLLVLDEPFVGLDPKAAFTLKEMFRAFCKEGGGIFFSTHVLEVAEKLCDRIGIIKAGKLIAEGTVSEVVGGGSLEETFLETCDA
ncbi:MAG: ABC transporter ATP-binding protein [Clostridia bacterium]|jgi:ABC transporter related|nr:ABC transporter ATP-binding protein [Clostridia bacterium]